MEVQEGSPLPEKATPHEIDEGFENTLERFSQLLKEDQNLLEGGFKPTEFSNFQDKFKDTFYQQREVFRNGGEFAGIRFEACQTPAHDFGHHIKRATLCQMIMLPGFLKEQKEKGVKYSQLQIQSALTGELLHDIGWLMTEKQRDQKKYQWSGEKFFDHCQDGAALAPQLAEALGLTLDQQTQVETGSRLDKDVLVKTIKGTEFNKLKEEEKAEKEEEKDIQALAKLSWAADFLSYFSEPEQITDVVSDLYKELFARAKGTRAQEFLKENVQKIAEKSIYTPEELQARFEQGILNVGQIKFPSETNNGIQTLQEFVASEFLPRFVKILENQIGFSDSFFAEQKDNWLKRNYYINIARVRALQEIAADFHPTNPLEFLEGSLTEADLTLWLDKLKREQILEEPKQEWQKFYQDFYRRNIDLKAIGLGEFREKPFFERLVTPEIREILKSVAQEKRVSSMAELFKIIKEKKRGPGSFQEIWLNLAPYTYTDAEGKKGNLLLEEEQWFEVLDSANKTKKGAKLKLCFCLRRDQYEMASSEEKQAFLAKLPSLKTRAKQSQQDFLITIGGAENQDNPLSRDKDFIEKLAFQGVKVFVNAGRIRKPECQEDSAEEKEYKKLLQENIETALSLAETPSVGQGAIVVGLQGLSSLDKNKINEIAARIITKKLPVMFSYTTDEDIGILEKIENHPFAILASQPEASIENLNFAIFMPHEFLPSSGPVESFRLIKALQKRQEIADELHKTPEELAWESYCIPLKAKIKIRPEIPIKMAVNLLEPEKERREKMIDIIREDYLRIFTEIKLAGKNFFELFQKPSLFRYNDR